MSAGEKIPTLVSSVFASFMWVRWYLVPAGLERLGAPTTGWTALHAIKLASHGVREVLVMRGRRSSGG